MASAKFGEPPVEAMEAFIRRQNLIILKRRLSDPNISDEKRRMLTRLLALEHATEFPTCSALADGETAR